MCDSGENHNEDSDSGIDSNQNQKISKILDLVIELGEKRQATPLHFIARLGRFEIRRLIGEGTFGQVYEAWDSCRQIRVAIKVARDHVCRNLHLKKRFLQEIELARQLNHPGIMKILESGEQDGLLFFAMELCHGRTLAQLIDDNRVPLPLHYGISVVRQAALAIQYAHQQGIIHRDLKPDNVMVLPRESDESESRELEVKILDFGLACIVHESFQSAASGTMIGSLMFIAPELLYVSDVQASCRTDVYALGTILYQCLTGFPHVNAETLPQLIDQIRTGEFISPGRHRPELPQPLELICMKCLNVDPQQRYGTAKELADDLESWSAGRPIKARPPTIRQQFSTWMRKSNRNIEFGLGLIVINLLVLGWAVLNYPLAIWFFPAGAGDQSSKRMFLEVLLAIIPVHSLLLWSSIRIYRLQQSRNGVWIHFLFTILIAFIAIPLICIENPVVQQLNRFERLAALGLMITFAEIQTLLTFLLLVFSYRRLPC